MSNAGFVLALCLLLGSVPAAVAQLTAAPLNQAQIQTDLFGQMLTGEYSIGGRWAERLNANMTSVYVEKGQPVHGHMSFIGSLLCFEYPQQEAFEGGCFEIWKRGANCFDFYSNRSSADLVERQWGRGWMARAWIADQPSTCKSDLIG